jgi:1,4-dihydroxy-2-naphthoate octaprenyltransferase
MIKLLRIARPHFLLASFFLFIMGCLWAVLLGGTFSLSRMLLAYLAILPAHLSISYSNDYFDVAVDALGKPSIFSGGSGVLVSHPELRNTARVIAIALIFLSLALAILFYLIFSFPIWFLGIVVVGNLIGWFYSAPPLRLSYRGWGELSTAFTAGLLPVMGYLVIYGRLNQDGLLLIPPLIFYGLAFILSVEIPDEEADRLGSKRTWVARMGRRFGFSAVAGVLLAATVYFFFIHWFSSRPLPVDSSVLILLSLIPLGAGCIGAIAKPVQKPRATRLANLIVLTQAAFFLLINVYFALLAF